MKQKQHKDKSKSTGLEVAVRLMSQLSIILSGYQTVSL